MARRRRRLRGAGVPGRGPSWSCPSPSDRAKWRLRCSPRLQTRRGGSGSPKLSTVPSSSPSGAVVWSCSLARGLFREGGSPHGQGPGSTSGWVRGGGAGERHGAAAEAGSTSRAPSRFDSPLQGRACPLPALAGEHGCAPQLREPRLPLSNGGGGCLARLGTKHGGGSAKASRGTPSSQACATCLRLQAKEVLQRASPQLGCGAGGGAPGRSPVWRWGTAQWVWGTKAGGPSAAGSTHRPPPWPPQKCTRYPKRQALRAGHPRNRKEYF